MVLFNRFPRFNPLSREEHYLISPQDRKNYAVFAANFDILDDVMMPIFHELDNEVLVLQNSYRCTHIILIFGGTLAAILSIVQIVFQDAVRHSIAITAEILLDTKTASRSFNYQERYVEQRYEGQRAKRFKPQEKKDEQQYRCEGLYPN